MSRLIHEEQDKMSPAGTTPESAGAVDSPRSRGSRKTLRGTVISTRMQKTITVRVERVYKHEKYKKYVRQHKHYHVHDEEGLAGVGDEVEIRECRPLSKLKRWRLISVLRKAELSEGGVS